MDTAGPSPAGCASACTTPQVSGTVQLWNSLGVGHFSYQSGLQTTVVWWHTDPMTILGLRTYSTGTWFILFGPFPKHRWLWDVLDPIIAGKQIWKITCPGKKLRSEQGPAPVPTMIVHFSHPCSNWWMSLGSPVPVQNPGIPDHSPTRRVWPPSCQFPHQALDLAIAFSLCGNVGQNSIHSLELPDRLVWALLMNYE